MVVCKSLADLVSTLGSKEFTEKLDTLHLLFTMWSKGQKVVLVDIREDNQLGREPGKIQFHHSSDKNSSEKTKNNIELSTHITTEKCEEVEEIPRRYVCSETDNEVGSDSEKTPLLLCGEKK
ncbi:hypothetical protein ACJMK2_002288 [Sinanodonta woodiana]|uniref:Uncharacterized protein n=1 Tax=Sinanodonta woodiana TaxID=1069815 RepID=A0ABD3XWH0_SINWO